MSQPRELVELFQHASIPVPDFRLENDRGSLLISDSEV